MDFSQLAQQIAPFLSVYFPDFDGTRDLGRGTAFPTTNILGGLTAGDRFFRTDLGFACYYDGARWLTMHTEVIRFPRTTYSAATTDVAGLAVLPSDYAVMLTRFEMYATLGVTNNGTNFWFYQLQRSSVDITGGVTTALGTGGGDYQLGQDLTTVVAINGYLNIRTAKTGAPSNATIAGFARYRMIVT